MADLDLRPQRRALLVSELRAALEAEVPGSRTSLRGSLASGMADPYSDIDICWLVPDDRFAVAVESASAAIRSAHPVLSQRIDPDLSRSDRRRLVFIRLADVPLFWRVDIDIRTSSVAANDGYDDGNPAARSKAGWSRPASAIENAIAAIKAAVRHQGDVAIGLLSRGYARINLGFGPATDLPRAITVLADSCAALEPKLAYTAAEVREVVDALSRAELLQLTLTD